MVRPGSGAFPGHLTSADGLDGEPSGSPIDCLLMPANLSGAQAQAAGMPFSRPPMTRSSCSSVIPLPLGKHSPR